MRNALPGAARSAQYGMEAHPSCPLLRGAHRVPLPIHRRHALRPLRTLEPSRNRRRLFDPIHPNRERLPIDQIDHLHGRNQSTILIPKSDRHLLARSGLRQRARQLFPRQLEPTNGSLGRRMARHLSLSYRAGRQVFLVPRCSRAKPRTVLWQLRKLHR